MTTDADREEKLQQSLELLAEVLKEESDKALVQAHKDLTAAISDTKNSIARKVKVLEMRAEVIATEVKERLAKREANSLSPGKGEGMFFLKELQQAGVSDWPAFYKFLAEQMDSGAPPDDVFSALNKKVKKEYVQRWLGEHEGELPPGVTWHREKTLQFRSN